MIYCLYIPLTYILLLIPTSSLYTSCNIFLMLYCFDNFLLDYTKGHFKFISKSRFGFFFSRCTNCTTYTFISVYSSTFLLHQRSGCCFLLNLGFFYSKVC
uniref:SJCHGC04171 protein n=1 Tax=Schistosoma japonicum TaxID=6182 RepID=Q5DH06_SCHJA|nr:SJCHGC04171 protein [Schistosoma japonicum]